jgi:hypothetical protein
VHPQRSESPRRQPSPAPLRKLLPTAESKAKQAERDAARYPISMQALPDAFSVMGELGMTGASYASWVAPEESAVSVRVELFGARLELPAKVLRVEPGARSVKVYVGFEALTEEAQAALRRWVDHHATWSTP